MCVCVRETERKTERERERKERERKRERDGMCRKDINRKERPRWSETGCSEYVGAQFIS